MKIRISVPQIRCRKVTHPKFDADEVYLAYVVGVGRPTQGNKAETAIIGGRISAVHGGVKKGEVWAPMPQAVTQIVDVGDAKLAYVAVALYEKDDGKLHERMAKELNGIVTPDKIPWNELVNVPDDVTSLEGWIKAVWKALIVAVRHLLQDDYLGRKDIVVAPEADAPEAGDDWRGMRELDFKRYGGDYRVTVSLEEA